MKGAKIIGFNRFYRDKTGYDCEDATQFGLAALSWNPILIDIAPSEWDPFLVCRFNFNDDDEFCYRVWKHFGPKSIGRLVCLITKFDVGKAAGGQ